MLTEEEQGSLRRKAAQDAAIFAPEDKEKANFWAKEILRQVAYQHGGISEACVYWSGEERLDAAGRVHELPVKEPAPVLTMVKNSA